MVPILQNLNHSINDLQNLRIWNMNVWYSGPHCITTANLICLQMAINKLPSATINKTVNHEQLEGLSLKKSV